MLSPDYLAHIPDAACALWQQVEEDILADIARRLAKMGEVTDTALWQVKRLEQIRLFRSGIVQRLKKASGQSEALIRQLLQLACTQALQADDVAHEATGQTVPPANDSIALRNLLTAGAKQTNGTMANITATTANTATRQFERALDRAWLQTTSGAFDYKTAVRRCVADLASTGLEAVRYPSGHVDTLEVAVRRAVVTGVNQSACRLQMERCKEVGCDLVEVTAHVGARPSHAQWQGKIYSISGKHPKYPPLSETGYGTGAGLGGWNCRHNMFPFWEGISEPRYTPQRLAELDAKDIEYKGKQYSRYEINQMQRSRERRVRRWKRQYAMEEAAGLDSTQTAVWLKKARVDLEHFTRDTGGRVDSARVGVHGFGRSQAARATVLAQKEEMFQKVLEKARSGDKISLTDSQENYLAQQPFERLSALKGKLPNRAVRKWYLAHDQKIPEEIDRTKTLREQAQQACNLRNQNRTRARDLMENQEERKTLDCNDPNKTFEELIEKYRAKGLRGDNIYQEILRSATRTRKSVNRKLGLEE